MSFVHTWITVCSCLRSSGAGISLRSYCNRPGERSEPDCGGVTESHQNLDLLLVVWQQLWGEKLLPHPSVYCAFIHTLSKMTDLCALTCDWPVPFWRIQLKWLVIWIYPVDCVYCSIPSLCSMSRAPCREYSIFSWEDADFFSLWNFLCFSFWNPAHYNLGRKHLIHISERGKKQGYGPGCFWKHHNAGFKSYNC